MSCASVLRISFISQPRFYKIIIPISFKPIDCSNAGILLFYLQRIDKYSSVLKSGLCKFFARSEREAKIVPRNIRPTEARRRWLKKEEPWLPLVATIVRFSFVPFRRFSFGTAHILSSSRRRPRRR